MLSRHDASLPKQTLENIPVLLLNTSVRRGKRLSRLETAVFLGGRLFGNGVLCVWRGHGGAARENFVCGVAAMGQRDGAWTIFGLFSEILAIDNHRRNVA